MFLQIPCPPALRPPWAPGDLASSLCTKFDDGEMQGGRLQGVPWREEQGTEISGGRGKGRDPTPEAAPGPAAVGSRTSGLRPRAGATRGGVRRSPQALTQEKAR